MNTDGLIERFVVRSFKSIVDQEIRLGLVNVFIGANGSGKSNVLEALGVLSAAVSGRVDDESLKRRGVRPGVPRLYKSAFGQRLAPHIYFEAHARRASYSVSLNNPLEKPRPAWLYKTENLRSDRVSPVTRGTKSRLNPEQGIAALKLVEIEESDPRAQLLNLLRDYALYAPNTLMLRGLIPDPQTREPLGLSGGRLAEAAKEFKMLALRHSFPAHRKLTSESCSPFPAEALEEVLDMIDWIEDFNTTTVAGAILAPSVSRSKYMLRFKDRYMREGKNTLTAYDASEGVLYILFCAILALLPEAPKCIAIDNLDQALNPRLAQKLTGLLCKWIAANSSPKQLLFTVHNPAVLDGLPLHDNRVKLFAVDRNSEGHTLVQPVVITDELRQLHEEKGWPLSRLWVMGHLGGVPNV